MDVLLWLMSSKPRVDRGFSVRTFVRSTMRSPGTATAAALVQQRGARTHDGPADASSSMHAARERGHHCENVGRRQAKRNTYKNVSERLRIRHRPSWPMQTALFCL